MIELPAVGKVTSVSAMPMTAEQRLKYYETEMKGAYQKLYYALKGVLDEELYREADFDNFADYLRSRTGCGIWWYRQLQTLVKASEDASRVFQWTFANKNAARAFRSEFGEWMDKGWLDELQDAFADKALAVSLHFGQTVNKAHVEELAHVMSTILRNRGYLQADLEGEEMTPFDAVLDNRITERINRQVDHIRDRLKTEWHRRQLGEDSIEGLMDAWMTADIPDGHCIEVRWAIVKEKSE